MKSKLINYMAAVVMGMNFFMIGIQESSVYMILPKYLSNSSDYVNNEQLQLSSANSSSFCFKSKPPYVMVTMVFLAKSLTQIFSNPICGGIITRLDNYVFLFITETLGIAISVIYAFSNSVYFYIFGRILDAFLSSGIFIVVLSLIPAIFADINIRGRYFGFANIMYYTGHAIGPFYGGGIDMKMGKSITFLLLIPIWIMTIMFSFSFYCIVRKQKLVKRKFINTEYISKEIQLKYKDCLKVENLENKSDDCHLKEQSNTVDNTEKSNNSENFTNSKIQKRNISKSTFQMLKDKFVLMCLLQLFVMHIAVYALPPTLPLWMSVKFCASESQQGIIWTFGLVGYILGLFIVILIQKYFANKCFFAPIFIHIIFGIILIMTPFSPSWKLLFIPVFFMYVSIGVIVQIIVPYSTLIADIRFHSDYGTMSSLISQVITISGVISTLSSGPLVSVFGFSTLAIGLGVINLIFSPISLVHRKIM